MKAPLVLDGPCLKDSLPVRLAATSDGGSRCEYFKGGRWRPGGGKLQDLLEAPWLRRAELRDWGIKPELAPQHPDR